MRHIVACCTSLLFAMAMGCSAPTDDPEPEGEDSLDVRAKTAVAPPSPRPDEETSTRTASSAVSFDAKLIHRGKPQPQPWRGSEPAPPVAPPATPSEGDHSNGSGSKN